jgi:hypothetical protein
MGVRIATDGASVSLALSVWPVVGKFATEMAVARFGLISRRLRQGWFDTVTADGLTTGRLTAM